MSNPLSPTPVAEIEAARDRLTALADSYDDTVLRGDHRRIRGMTFHRLGNIIADVRLLLAKQEAARRESDDTAPMLRVPLDENDYEALASARYCIGERMRDHEDDDDCDLPVNHVQTLLELADAVIVRSGRAVEAARQSTPTGATNE